MERLRAHTTIFYSTHILDDVERVSDQVAILDHGRLVVSAPTVELLDGDTAGYELTIRGNGQEVAQVLRAQPWVTDVTEVPQDDSVTLLISVTDDDAAESRLLRLALADDVVVTAFGRTQSKLEDVFLHLVKGREQ
jgi:ABC-2 type transport system ATP-binding protein